jgi:hypothetical protein
MEYKHQQGTHTGLIYSAPVLLVGLLERDGQAISS